MTATLYWTSADEDLARWDALTPKDRHAILAAHWQALDPATARARFAAAIGVLALVDEELDAAQRFVNDAVERALVEASAGCEATR